jgi:hypothetical protein
VIKKVIKSFIQPAPGEKWNLEDDLPQREVEEHFHKYVIGEQGSK